MALLQCKECGKNVSDRALSCPGCGNPIADSAELNAVGSRVSTIQATSKKLKMQQFLSVLMVFLGWYF